MNNGLGSSNDNWVTFYNVISKCFFDSTIFLTIVIDFFMVQCKPKPKQMCHTIIFQNWLRYISLSWHFDKQNLWDERMGSSSPAPVDDKYQKNFIYFIQHMQ